MPLPASLSSCMMCGVACNLLDLAHSYTSCRMRKTGPKNQKTDDERGEKDNGTSDTCTTSGTVRGHVCRTNGATGRAKCISAPCPLQACKDNRWKFAQTGAHTSLRGIESSHLEYKVPGAGGTAVRGSCFHIPVASKPLPFRFPKSIEGIFAGTADALINVTGPTGCGSEGDRKCSPCSQHLIP